MVTTIYVPKGKAFEYSPLALNLYSGCEHNCSYCYCPAVLRKSREQFCEDPQPRKGIIEQLRKDVDKFIGDTRPILMSFTSDPYQPCEEKHQVTRQTIKIMGDTGLKMKVLTKNGSLAQRDFDLLKKYDVDFGQTIIFLDETARAAFEPGAPCIASRVEALRAAHMAGIKTWVSLEPVIDPQEALKVIAELSAYVDLWKIGKLNHDKERESKINWTEFLRDVLRLIYPGLAYYIKNDLWAFADDEIKKQYPKEHKGMTLNRTLSERSNHVD